jgi:hypothetical protein
MQVPHRAIVSEIHEATGRMVARALTWPISAGAAAPQHV